MNSSTVRKQKMKSKTFNIASIKIIYFKNYKNIAKEIICFSLMDLRTFLFNFFYLITFLKVESGFLNNQINVIEI